MVRGELAGSTGTACLTGLRWECELEVSLQVPILLEHDLRCKKPGCIKWQLLIGHLEFPLRVEAISTSLFTIQSERDLYGERHPALPNSPINTRAQAGITK